MAGAGGADALNDSLDASETEVETNLRRSVRNRNPTDRKCDLATVHLVRIGQRNPHVLELVQQLLVKTESCRNHCPIAKAGPAWPDHEESYSKISRQKITSHFSQVFQYFALQSFTLLVFKLDNRVPLG